jgi:hypothetical protein
MSEYTELRVETFTAKRVRNENPGGKLTWQTFHEVRNAVFRTCRTFGSTGRWARSRSTRKCRT